MKDATDISLYIYDRWGNLMTSATDKNLISWDGSYQGSDAIVGVYVYSLTYANDNGEVVSRFGDITLVR